MGMHYPGRGAVNPPARAPGGTPSATGRVRLAPVPIASGATIPEGRGPDRQHGPLSTVVFEPSIVTHACSPRASSCTLPSSSSPSPLSSPHAASRPTSRRVALCLHDLLAGHPFVVTTGWCFVRFHGPDALRRPCWGRHPEAARGHRGPHGRRARTRCRRARLRRQRPRRRGRHRRPGAAGPVARPGTGVPGTTIATDTTVLTGETLGTGGSRRAPSIASGSSRAPSRCSTAHSCGSATPATRRATARSASPRPHLGGHRARRRSPARVRRAVVAARTATQPERLDRRRGGPARLGSARPEPCAARATCTPSCSTPSPPVPCTSIVAQPCRASG
jgi:hypothetical protein